LRIQRGTKRAFYFNQNAVEAGQWACIHGFEVSSWRASKARGCRVEMSESR
jgi:hypothetical protein